MPHAPDISVIIPVRNGKDYIEEATNSVVKQNFPNMEIIIVNDGSTDFNYDDLKSIDPRISIVHLTGLGVSSARNAGMAAARGRYFAFLDADDYWQPGKIAAQFRHMEERTATGGVFGGFQKWSRSESGDFPEPETLRIDCEGATQLNAAASGWLYTRLMRGLIIGMSTFLIRREVYDQLGGFDATVPIGEDYLFWFNISQHYTMDCLDADLTLYRIHSGSAMAKLHQINHHGALLLRAEKTWGLSGPDGDHISKKEFRRLVGQTEFNHGYDHFWRGDPTIAAKSFRNALSAGVRPERSMAYLALSRLKQLKRLLSNSKPDATP